jgi:hypothetical protein
MARGSTWTNKDGLVVGFGTHTEDNDITALYGGTEKTLVVEYDLANLSDTFAATNVKPQDVVIPRGSVFTEGYITTLVAATSGGAGTLDIGTWGVGLTTEVVDDADGLVADVTIAEMTSIGEVHVLDGALIATAGTTAAGAVSDSNVVIAPSYETAAFTAGRIRLTVKYIVPAGSTGGTIAAVN